VLQRILRSLIFLVVMVSLGLQPAVSLAAGIPIIRDTEIENTVRTWSTPIFRAAALDPSAVDIYIVNDKGINAFVAGGQKLFLNTGLLKQSNTANEVIGVIAHEVGHIQGGHLVRVHDALHGASVESILALVVGVAAGIASGRPDVGQAIIAGGQDAALRSFLRYSQTQEGAADSAAMRLLDATGQSSQGLLDFLRTMEDQELLSVGRQDPYLRSHPLTRDRINALEEHVRRSPHTAAADPQGYAAMYARMKAKLTAFLEPASTTFREYPESDQSAVARYAHAIAWFRNGNLAKAVPAIDALIAAHPEDPFYHELKGQMLFESGRPAEALGPYRTAVQLLPAAPLLRFELARVQLALNDPGLIEDAIGNLRTGLMREPDSAAAWRQLAIAYGRNGQMGESALAQAEEALIQGRADEAIYHAGKAERLLTRGSRSWLQAQDIQRFAEQKARQN
jgi:predicted Zn-dependent protease